MDTLDRVTAKEEKADENTTHTEEDDMVKNYFNDSTCFNCMVKEWGCSPAEAKTRISTERMKSTTDRVDKFKEVTSRVKMNMEFATMTIADAKEEFEYPFRSPPSRI